jgi:hypothetical protein
MGFTSRLLGLTAKIGLDLLIGSTRTDEAIALFQEWFAARAPDERASEVAAARTEAGDSASVRSSIEQAAAETGTLLSVAQVKELSEAVVSGLDSLPVDAPPDPTALVEQLVLRRATFAVWLDLQKFGGGPGHYCHFNWDGEAYRIRDFIGGRIYHPPGRRVTESGLTAVEIPLTALAIWQASRGRVQCLSQYGLAFPVTERERWCQVLRLLSEVANQWQQNG